MGKSKKANSQEMKCEEWKQKKIVIRRSTSKPDAKSSKHNASVCVTTDRNATDSSVTEVNKTHIADPFEHS